MQRGCKKIAVLVSNHFTQLNFDNAIKNISNVGHIDVISSDTGKVRSWDKKKEYYGSSLFTDELTTINPLDYSAIIVYANLLDKKTKQ